MKTIGLIGGMSWESTVTYYSVINEFVRDRLGGLHSARLLLYSVEFADLEAAMSRGDWKTCETVLIDAAQRLERAGADLILICTNTMHKLFDRVSASVHVPMIHIAEATAEALERKRVRSALLLGTRFTMREEFIRTVLERKGIRVLVPEDTEMDEIDRVIFDELCKGKIREDSRGYFASVIRRMKGQGAEAVIFGCTEIGLLLGPEDSPLPAFDTTLIHAGKAAEIALEGE